MTEMNPGYINPQDPWGGERKRIPRREPSNAEARQRAVESIEALKRYIDELDKQDKEFPEPPNGTDRFTVQLRFKRSGAIYTYLLLRTPKGWYNTGGSHFDTWEGVLNWLHGPRVAWHSPMMPLQLPGMAVPVVPEWNSK